MDILGGLQLQIDTLWYNVLLSFAGLHWSVLRGFVMMGYNIELLNHWLEEQAFSPLIAATNDSLRVAVSLAFVVALLVLGLTYLLSAFIRLEVVSLHNALLWYAAGALFFTLGPSLYEGMSHFRSTVSQALYLSTLDGLEGSMGDAFSSLNRVSSTDLEILTPCDNLGVYLPQQEVGRIDGLDIALAYLRADGVDIMGYEASIHSPGCPAHLQNPLTGSILSTIPMEWNMDNSYFDIARSPLNFDEMTPEARRLSNDMAAAAQGRMLTAWPLVIFGVTEQLVYLLITVAQGITFISFSAAMLFAFFKKTEIIARSIIDQWIELIVQTVVIALVQSLVVAFFLTGTASGNGMVVLGIGLICLIFMVITLWSGVRAVWGSFNRLFGAMGQATGGVIVSPGAASAVTAGIAASGAGAMLNAGTTVGNVGSSALAGWNALQNGATRAQAAGLMFGGWEHLTDTARSITRLPGLRGTTLGEGAEQFMEGVVTRQVLGPLMGAKLLTNRDPNAVEYDESGRVLARPMLIPAVGEGLERWVTPGGKAKRRATGDEGATMEDDNGDLIPLISSPYPRRMGTFTPIATSQDASAVQRAQERSDYRAEMNNEEMETHLSEQLRANRGGNADSGRMDGLATRLEAGADALNRAAQSLTGHLKVSGAENVAGVMGDVVRQVQASRIGGGNEITGGLDTLSIANRIARAVGVNPVPHSPPISQDLSRLSLFADSALRLGLSGEQTERVVSEVKASPDGTLLPSTRQELVESVQRQGHRSWEASRNEVQQLEHTARMLPLQITAFGEVTLQPQIVVKHDGTEAKA